MRIGIITFTEGYNYGNKLQNYALLKYIEGLNKNKDVFTLDNHVSTVRFKDKIIIGLKSLVPSKKHFAYKIRQNKFNQFNKKYLNFTNQKLRRNTKTFKEIDAFVCGSDQIWNPNYYDSIDSFVGKIGENKKSISYAASFGVSSLSDNVKERYAKSLQNLKAISVRENQGQVICHQLGLEDVQVNVDPTFLLSCSKWLSVERKPNIEIPEKYVFTYFIGKISKETNNKIDDYCKNNSCKRIDLNSISSLQYFCFDPFEFLYLLNHSEFVFTDSFHASVFSIIFGKKFIVFRRIISEKEQMHSRIETLLKLFNLENHFFDKFDGDFKGLDYSRNEVESIIAKQVEKSEKYFKENLFN